MISNPCPPTVPMTLTPESPVGLVFTPESPVPLVLASEVADIVGFACEYSPTPPTPGWDELYDGSAITDGSEDYV